MLTIQNDKLSAQINDVERLLRDILRALYADDAQVPGLMELPVAQLRALNVLGRDPEGRAPTMGELADALGVALSTATQLAERLEKRGLARRDHSDPEDRRVVRLSLTGDGRRLLEDRRRLRHRRLESAMEHLSPAQQDHLTDALSPLADAARRMEPEEMAR